MMTSAPGGSLGALSYPARPTLPGWRAAVRWHRSALHAHRTGAIDLPGTTWHDRPAVSRGSTCTVATDQSAAPGLLAEVGIAAAQLALQHLGESCDRPY